MPMTFAAQIGGMGTPIGTSLNLLVIGTSREPRRSNASGCSISSSPRHWRVPSVSLYLWLVAPRLLPARETANL